MNLPPAPLNRPATRRRGGREALLSGLAVIVLGYVVMLVGVFGFGWSGPTTLAVSRFVPVPVGFVGWKPVWLHSYLDQKRALDHYATYLHQSSPEAFQPVPEREQAVQALTKEIRDVGIANLLDRYHVKVTRADIDQAYTSQIVQNGNADQVMKDIAQLYGWTPQQFKNSVLVSAVGREKLREKISFDDQLNKPARDQADRVLALVKEGKTSFEDLAKQYSDDVYAGQGGDAGFVSRGDQVEELDTAVFSLPIGQVSDIIHTKFGFHIVKVEEKKNVDGEDQVRYRSIFIAAPSVDDFITAYLKTARVGVFVPHLAWDAGKGTVTSR